MNVAKSNKKNVWIDKASLQLTFLQEARATPPTLSKLKQEFIKSFTGKPEQDKQE